MAYLSEKDNIMTQEGILRAYTYEDIQLVLENEREFMQPEYFHGKMTSEEKLKLRKKILLKIARKTMMESVNDAMYLLDKYAEDLIKITAPREKVIDGDVKTLQGWKDSGVSNFNEYVVEGDKVDYDMVMEFANCVPPKTFNSGMIQCGEPYDHVKEGARYGTFIYLYKDENYGGEVWQYKGNCLANSCEKGCDINKSE